MVSYFTDHLSTYCTNRGAVIGRQYKKALSEEAQAKQTLIDAREQFIALYIANETVASQKCRAQTCL
ncbi:hypothetical protein JCM19233_1793 [Vibrio astriarenae]|nr:hypothetical protein JCM19233_1793 [Vibrio sp. C7]